MNNKVITVLLLIARAGIITTNLITTTAYA